MSTEQIIIILVVAIVLVLAVVALVAAGAKKKKAREAEERRVQAGELRQQAGGRAPDVRDSKLAAAEAGAEAELLRVRAERAEQDAAEVRKDAAADQARQEDVVRQADRLDPDVDHRADGYRPAADLADPVDPMDPADPATQAGPARTTDRTETGPDETPSGSHRA
ncbi:MAG: hypothetical protein LH468_10585 [Nocardioides sp.]|nr:hypothetical protein [Nocardioides sp.]